MPAVNESASTWASTAMAAAQEASSKFPNIDYTANAASVDCALIRSQMCRQAPHPGSQRPIYKRVRMHD